MTKLLPVLLALLAASCSSYFVDARSLEVRVDPSPDERPLRVNVCDIAADPAAYNKKLVQINGFVSRGFEDSSLFDPTCNRRYGIWVEIGGKVSTGTMYCCGVSSARSRSKDLEVEGETIPLIANDTFYKFDKLLERKPDSIAKATLVGRFFSGKKTVFPGGEYWTGYGHMGMNSLFVIQEVVDVAAHDQKDIDYGASVDQPDTDAEGCGTYTILRDQDTTKVVEIQRKAEAGDNAWALDDPKRVASEGLVEMLKGKLKATPALTETRRSDGRSVYHWRPNGRRGVRYMVVVSRPYWLSTYAKNPARTAWILSAAYSICD